MKPTLASLKRAEKQAKDALEMRDKVIKMHERAWETNTALRAELDAIRSHLRPVLAYFGQQWIGDKVRADFQALVAFTKGSGDE